MRTDAGTWRRGGPKLRADGVAFVLDRLIAEWSNAEINAALVEAGHLPAGDWLSAQTFSSYRKHRQVVAARAAARAAFERRAAERMEQAIRQMHERNAAANLWAFMGRLAQSR